MGSTRVECPHCRGSIAADDLAAAGPVVCSRCGRTVEAWMVAAAVDAADLLPPMRVPAPAPAAQAENAAFAAIDRATPAPVAATPAPAPIPTAAPIPSVPPVRVSAPVGAKPLPQAKAIPSHLALQTAPAAATPQTTPAEAFVSVATAPAAQPGTSPRGHARQTKKNGFGPLEIVKVVLGGGAGIALGYLVVFWIQNRDGGQANQPRPTKERSQVARDVQVEFPKFKPQPSDPRPATESPAFVPPADIGFGSSTGSGTGSASPRPSPPPPRVTKVLPSVTPSSAPSASPPVALSPKSLLDGLSPILRLPPLVDSSRVDLSPVHLPDGKALDISFNSMAANVPPEAAFFADRKEGSAKEWIVSYAPNVSGPAQEKKPIAEMAIVSGQLQFQWGSPVEDLEIRRELANCVARLACDNDVKTALLRAPLDVPRISVDLGKDASTTTLAVTDVPREEQIRLEIADLANFSHEPLLKDERRVLKLKERATIQFAQMKGAEIHLDFRRSPAGEFQITLRPEFRENQADKFAMTLTRLADMKEGLEKAIPEAEARIVSLTRDLKALDDELRKVGPRPNGAAFVAWQSKVNRLQSALSSAKSKLSTQQRRLPEMKVRLAAVPQVQSFLEGLHQKASLKLSIYAECGDSRLSLVEAKLDPVAANQ